jgi:hypothetical protein
MGQDGMTQVCIDGAVCPVLCRRRGRTGAEANPLRSVSGPHFTLPDGAGRPGSFAISPKALALLFTGGSAPGEDLSNAATKLEPLESVLVTVATASPCSAAPLRRRRRGDRRFTTGPRHPFIDGDGILVDSPMHLSPDAVVYWWSSGQQDGAPSCRPVFAVTRTRVIRVWKALHGIGTVSRRNRSSNGCSLSRSDRNTFRFAARLPPRRGRRLASLRRRP